MNNNPYLTKTRILIHLQCIVAEYTKLAIELKDLPPESEIYHYLITSKLLPSKNFVERLYKEAKQIDIKQPHEAVN
jgi:hypothetical protein